MIAKVPESEIYIVLKIKCSSLFRNRYSNINNNEIICLYIG